MTMRAFIRANRTELDAVIRRATGRPFDRFNPPALNDDERQRWILNDEGLYRWARSEGVRI